MGKAELLISLRYNGITSERVLQAMANVPRDEFVRPEDRDWAWEDSPLPVGEGQTISQPFVVAWMTQLVDVAPGDSVLDVGTGCGYQAAVLAAMGATVHSVEIRPALARSAAQRLQRLGFTGVHVRCADGRDGLAEFAPFDAIVVAAATHSIPEPLMEQLREPGDQRRGGRLILPLKSGWPDHQRLVLIERTAQGFHRSDGLPVRFVPLVGPSN